MILHLFQTTIHISRKLDGIFPLVPLPSWGQCAVGISVIPRKLMSYEYRYFWIWRPLGVNIYMPAQGRFPSIFSRVYSSQGIFAGFRIPRLNTALDCPAGRGDASRLYTVFYKKYTIIKCYNSLCIIDKSLNQPSLERWDLKSLFPCIHDIDTCTYSSTSWKSLHTGIWWSRKKNVTAINPTTKAHPGIFHPHKIYGIHQTGFQEDLWVPSYCKNSWKTHR